MAWTSAALPDSSRGLASVPAPLRVPAPLAVADRLPWDTLRATALLVARLPSGSVTDRPLMALVS